MFELKANCPGVEGELMTHFFWLLLTLGRLPGPDGVCLWHVQPGGGILEHVCGGGTV